MPVLLPSSLLSNLSNHHAPTDLLALSTRALNSTEDALQVVCAWPVSGQYGIGSRILYYVLVAASVFGRRQNWLRGPCLVAALIFPAVAALHGIVLAATHVQGAIDMDIYGAFQFCSIGILAAPATARLSSTYFNEPGRNSIFLWTGLVLAGLLSLTVEFYRSEASPCERIGDSVNYTLNSFLTDDQSAYPELSPCLPRCSVDDGPFSPMRQGSAKDIYIIPAPTRLTFGTCTLLAAACCIPALLSLAFIWIKIIETNWSTMTRFSGGGEDDTGSKQEQPALDTPIEGTNITVGGIRSVNSLVKKLLGAVEIPVFGGAVIAILALGEMNFFTAQISYQTEPIASVGQWAPIAGTTIAALGSLYLLVADKTGAALEREKEHLVEETHDPTGPMSTNPSPGNQGQPNMPTTPGSRRSEDAAVSITSDHETTIDPTQALPNQAEMTNESNERNSRQSVTNILIQINDYLTATKHVDESAEFRGARSAYPVTPAEAFLNDKLHETKERYSQLQALEKNTSGSVTPSQLPPSREGRSRSPSFAGSMASTSGPDISHHRGGSMSSRGPSPLRPQGATEIQQRRHAKTLPGVSTPSSAAVTTANPPASSSSLPAQRSGDNTHLEVPSPSYRGAR